MPFSEYMRELLHYVDATERHLLARTHACMHLYLRASVYAYAYAKNAECGRVRRSLANKSAEQYAISSYAVPFADDSFTSSSRVRRREFLRTFPARRDDIPAYRGCVFQREHFIHDDAT